MINEDILKEIKNIAERIFKSFKCDILELNGEADHIHILFEAPPQVQLSKLVNNFKTVSSRLIRKEFKVHVDKFYWKNYFWSESYLIINTGGAPIKVIQQYIQDQSTPKA